MTVSLAQYAEQKRDEAGESVIPSGVHKRWQERIVANSWHEMGKEGATKYLDKYGQNIGAAKVIQFARQAEAEGCQEMAQGFWRKAYELELGHPPPAADVDNEPAPVPVPLELTESEIQEMEARKDVQGLTKALYYRSPDRASTTWEKFEASKVRLLAANALIRIDHVQATKVLIKALQDDDGQVRASAAGGLVDRLCSAQAMGPLLEALKDDFPDARRNAALALGRTGDVGAVSALIASLKDDDSHVRGYAAEALGQLGDVRAVDALIEALKDGDSDLRSRAAGALGQLGDVRATEALRGATLDDQKVVRISAAKALKKVSKLEHDQSLPSQSEVKEMEARRDVDSLIQALRWEGVKAAVISALGRLGDPRAVDALILALQEDGYYGALGVRESAVKALGRIGGERAEAALADVLKSGTPGTRIAAVKALGQMGGGPRAVDALLYALKEDTDPRARLAVVEVLVQMGGGSRAVDALLHALKEDADPRTRLAVVEALGQMADARATAALVQAIKDDTANEVRRSATEALQLLAGDRAAEAVAQLLQDDDAHVRERAARELGWLGGPRAEKALAPALNDEAEGVRLAVTHALAQLGGTEALAALLQALRDDAGQVRMPTVAALGKRGDARAVPALIEVLKDDPGPARAAAAQALGQIRDERAVPVLMETLKDKAEEVRTAAAQSLGQIGDERAVDALVEALADADCAKVAAWALAQIGGIHAEKALPVSVRPSELRLCLEELPAELAASFKAEFAPFKGNIEGTIQPYIEIQSQSEDRVILWHSKFGGRPYLPQRTPYPTAPNGRPLFLLAQINFAQVPRLEPFPREGILQFYIADNNLNGMDFGDLRAGDLTTQKGFRILYFPQVIEDEKELVTDFGFLPKPKFPISKPHSLTFARRYAPISAGDYRFESAIFGKDPSPPEETLQVYERTISSYGNKIGGYPYFVTWHDRYDPRKKKARKEEEYEILLLQTSDTWFGGEWGMLRFFIQDKDLRKLDFSRVMYYCDWDID